MIDLLLLLVQACALLAGALQQFIKTACQFAQLIFAGHRQDYVELAAARLAGAGDHLVYRAQKSAGNEHCAKCAQHDHQHGSNEQIILKGIDRCKGFGLVDFGDQAPL